MTMTELEVEAEPQSTHTATTMALDEFLAQPTIASQFPLVFDHGGRWDSFHGKCGSCHAMFEQEDVRGHVTRPFARVFIVEGNGYCHACKRLTPFAYRFHDDMGMTGRSPETGEWARWEPKRSAWWRTWLRRLRGA